MRGYYCDIDYKNNILKCYKKYALKEIKKNDALKFLDRNTFVDDEGFIKNNYTENYSDETENSKNYSDETENSKNYSDETENSENYSDEIENSENTESYESSSDYSSDY